MNKKQFAKDILDGTLTKAQAAYIIELEKTGNCYVFFYTDFKGRLLPCEQEKKELYDRLPEKYKSVFHQVNIDTQDAAFLLTEGEKKAMYDSLPETYRAIFPPVVMDMQFKGLGAKIKTTIK